MYFLFLRTCTILEKIPSPFYLEVLGRDFIALVLNPSDGSGEVWMINQSSLTQTWLNKRGLLKRSQDVDQAPWSA